MSNSYWIAPSCVVLPTVQSGEDESLYYFRQARLGDQTTVSTVNGPENQLLTIELEGSGSVELSLSESLIEGDVLPKKKSAKYTISSPVYVDPGSLGYVPFYSGSQLLDSTTSIFYDSGSYYIGIGNTAWTTTPPAYPLDIQCDTNISGSLSVTGSTLITGSMGVYGDSFISGNLGVDGVVTAKELHITYVTSSVLYESGSTKFGNTFDDTHEITGSVMITGSFLIDGSGSGVIINSNTNISGSLTSTGSTVLSGSLSLIGPADLDSDVDISGSLTVTGSTKVGYISGSDAHFTSVETDYVDFTGVTPAHEQGRLYYNEKDHHLAYSTENNEVELHLGQHLAARVKNNSGGTINKGQVALITGSGTPSTPYVTTASFDAEYSSASTLGVAMVDMDHNSHGYVLLQGILEEIDTSTYSAGEMLYLSSSGDITNVVPVTPYHEVRIGQVLRVSQDSGSIFVRVQNGYEIEELHNVLVQNTSIGDLLVYNDSAGYWENTRQLTGSYGITGSLEVDGHLTASGHISASVFYGDASQLTNLPSSGITALVDDPSPQLGGILDVNGKAISGSLVQITGSTSISGDLDVSGSLFGDVQGTLTGSVLGDVTGSLTGSVLGDVTGNVTGDVTGSLLGDVTGSLLGDVQGNVTGSLLGNVTGDVTGSLLGDVQGNVTGSLLGNVTGDVTGSLLGNVTGDVTGSLLGNVTGDVTGSLLGNVTGDVTGSLLGNVTGDVTGSLLGNVTGDVTGSLLGNVTGDVTGSLLGNVTGDVTGSLLGNVTGDVTGSLLGNVTGSISGSSGVFGVLESYGDSFVSGNFAVDGTLTAKEFHTTFVTSSVLYESGSTKFGDSADDTHEFTGSLLVDDSTSASSVSRLSFISGSSGPELLIDASGSSNPTAGNTAKIRFDDGNLQKTKSQIRATQGNINLEAEIGSGKSIRLGKNEGSSPAGYFQVSYQLAQASHAFKAGTYNKSAHIFNGSLEIINGTSSHPPIVDHNFFTVKRQDDANPALEVKTYSTQSPRVQISGSLYLTGGYVIAPQATGLLAGNSQVTVATGSGVSQVRLSSSAAELKLQNDEVSIIGSTNISGPMQVYSDSFVSGNFAVDGTLTAKEFHTTFVTSSVLYESGSTKFGDSADDTHEFSGSIYSSGTQNLSIVSPSGNAIVFDVGNTTIKGKTARLVLRASNVADLYGSNFQVTEGGAWVQSVGTPWDLISGKRWSFRANDTDGYYLYLGSIPGTPKMVVTGSSVGIGTATPEHELDVVGNAQVSGSLYLTGGYVIAPQATGLLAGNSQVTVATGSGISQVRLSSSAAELKLQNDEVQITGSVYMSSSAGQSYFGSLVDGASFDVNNFGAVASSDIILAGATSNMTINSGGIYLTGSTGIHGDLDVSGDITCTSLTETSARDLKDNVRSMNNELYKVLKLRPVSYDWKETKESDKGFIAEELNEVYPELTSVDDDGKSTGVKYTKMTSVLTRALQELHHIVETQQKQINKLKDELTILRDKDDG